jgi:hypothetical protein
LLRRAYAILDHPGPLSDADLARDAEQRASEPLSASDVQIGRVERYLATLE